MLEALGVNTSRTFAVFETGEELVRGDEPSPTRSAVLTRLSHGHIRIGSFQRHAFEGATDRLDQLVRYSLEHLYSEQPSKDASANALRLFDLVCAATAKLAASYMAAGFVHGVLNSDNINITGESFDYGPWRFTPTWDASFTAAYFDHYGLYAFGRQPEAIHWDVAQFAGCLSLLTPAEGLSETLNGWAERFEDALVAALIQRLGVAPAEREADRKLAAAIIRALETADASRSTASSSTGAAAAIRAENATRPSPSATLPANSTDASASRPTLTGRMPSPARCTSTRSRRSGRRSPSATTGPRSTPRSPPFVAWATRCVRTKRTRLDPARLLWWSRVHVDQPDFHRARHRQSNLERGARRCRRRSRRRPRRLPRMGGPLRRLPDRGAAPLRQCRAQARAGVRDPDRARDRQAAVGSADRGRRGRQQGRHLGQCPRRAHAQAHGRGGDGQQGAGPAQAARRAGGARAVQFPRAPAQRPHRPGADRRQHHRLQAVGKDPGDRRVAGPLLSRGGHSRRRGAAADRRARRRPRARVAAGHRRLAVHRLGPRRHGAAQAVRRDAAQDPRARAWRQQPAGRVARQGHRRGRGDRRPVGLSQRRPALHRRAPPDRRGRRRGAADRGDHPPHRPDHRRPAVRRPAAVHGPGHRQCRPRSICRSNGSS